MSDAVDALVEAVRAWREAAKSKPLPDDSLYSWSTRVMEKAKAVDSIMDKYFNYRQEVKP